MVNSIKNIILNWSSKSDSNRCEALIGSLCYHYIIRRKFKFRSLLNSEKPLWIDIRGFVNADFAPTYGTENYKLILSLVVIMSIFYIHKYNVKVFVSAVRGLSPSPSSISFPCGDNESSTKTGAHRGIRTHTLQGLSLLPCFQLGYTGKIGSTGGIRTHTTQFLRLLPSSSWATVP